MSPKKKKPVLKPMVTPARRCSACRTVVAADKWEDHAVACNARPKDPAVIGEPVESPIDELARLENHKRLRMGMFANSSPNVGRGLERIEELKREIAREVNPIVHDGRDAYIKHLEDEAEAARLNSMLPADFNPDDYSDVPVEPEPVVEVGDHVEDVANGERFVVEAVHNNAPHGEPMVHGGGWRAGNGAVPLRHIKVIARGPASLKRAILAEVATLHEVAEELEGTGTADLLVEVAGRLISAVEVTP